MPDDKQKFDFLTRRQFGIAAVLQGRPLTRKEILQALAARGQKCSPAALHQMVQRLKRRELIDEHRDCEQLNGPQSIHFYRYRLNENGRAAVVGTLAQHAVDSGLGADELRKIIDRAMK